MNSYPFLDYINEDKSHYKTATEAGYIDPHNLFLIGDSGGFLLNINNGPKFINTELFTEVGDYYSKHKIYTSYKIDSIPHRQFRKREQHRRKHGFTAPCLQMPDGTIVDVYITGGHYNFLNYTNLEQLDESTIQIGINNTAKKTQELAKFIDAQYWTWHIMKFAENNGFHLIIDKTRRGGFSYIMASDSANEVNANSHKVVIHVAEDKKYLTMTGGLTDFATSNIRFFEQVTPFVRGIYSPVKSDFKLGYKLPDGTEAANSWRSALISVSAYNNDNCAIGKDAVRIKVEEISTMTNFDGFMEVTEPAMRTGAYTTGFLCAWGTSTSGNMQVFEQNFYNPRAYNFMPFENVWDKDARSEICGFFKPYCWGLQGELDGIKSLDKDGNSNILVGLQVAKKEREVKKANAKTYSEYIRYLGQYANMPSESFSNASENIFSSEELNEWELRLKTDNDFKFYVDGMYELKDKDTVYFKSNTKIRLEGNKAYDYIIGVPRRGNEDPHGCVRRWFPPESIEIPTSNGIRREIPAGLYEITYDPVGVDKDKKEITNKHSHNSIKVWMNPHPLNQYKQKLVACYYGRPDKLEYADRICLNLAIAYNCIRNTHVEINRGETVSNFKKWGGLKYLSYEPIFLWDASLKGKYSSSFGYNMSDSTVKLEAIRLTQEFLYDEIGKDENGKPVRNFHRIFDYQTIVELKKWSTLGNFDRVSEMLLRGISWKARKELSEQKLSNVTDLTGENLDENDILNRDWYV